MRAIVIGLALAAATATMSAVAGPADAPADEYFGPFKYSAIALRTKINALGRSYRERWQDDDSIVHDADMLESSYQAWARKYPGDRWLAPTAYHLAQLYQVLQSNRARNRARALYEYVAKTFPATTEGHAARLRLRQGFPALHAESPVSPTPNPYASPTPTPVPTETPTPEPTETPPPTPSPSPTPPPKRRRL
jgi:hypothetical protein